MFDMVSEQCRSHGSVTSSTPSAENFTNTKIMSTIQIPQILNPESLLECISKLIAQYKDTTYQRCNEQQTVAAQKGPAAGQGTSAVAAAGREPVAVTAAAGRGTAAVVAAGRETAVATAAGRKTAAVAAAGRGTAAVVVAGRKTVAVAAGREPTPSLAAAGREPTPPAAERRLAAQKQAAAAVGKDCTTAVICRSPIQFRHHTQKRRESNQHGQSIGRNHQKLDRR